MNNIMLTVSNNNLHCIRILLFAKDEYVYFDLTSGVNSDMIPNTQLEHEKRVRREIANSNERRRMQSINTGFQNLKILIPHSCGEKLSKVCKNFDE